MGIKRILNLPSVKKAGTKYLTTERTPEHLKGMKRIVTPEEGPQGLAGAAFDYLARLHIARQFKHSSISVYQSGWLSKSVPMKVDYDFNGPFHYDIGYDDEWKEILDTAHEQSENYITNNACLNCLSHHVQYMAHADLLYRTMTGFNYNFESSRRVARELIKMMVIFDPGEIFRPREQIVLNPVFADGRIFGGADADLIVDDTLVEIKAVSRLSVTKEILMQLGTYLALHDTGGILIDGKPSRTPLANVGIYFARYGKYVKIPIAEMFPDGGYEHFKEIVQSELENRRAKYEDHRKIMLDEYGAEYAIDPFG